jgi:hypothetical protein
MTIKRVAVAIAIVFAIALGAVVLLYATSQVADTGRCPRDHPHCGSP